MKVFIVAEHFRVDDKTEQILLKEAKKLERFLEGIDADVPKLTYHFKYHPQNRMYTASVRFSLIKKLLSVSGSGINVYLLIKMCGKKLLRELGQYKGKHYISHTEYPRRDSIRLT